MSTSVRSAVILPVLLGAAVAAFAQDPPRFEDVVRNLRNPDPKIRISAVRLLREAGYTEAIAPIAPLVNDSVNEIQIEAIASELAFYLVEPVPAKKRVAFVVEVRTEGRAPAAFELGPLAVWPKPVPAELVDALLQAVDDDNGKVRLEAIYTLGVIGRKPLSDAAAARLIKALDHYDPAIRAAAARVIGRLQVKSAGDGLLTAVNDGDPARNARFRR
jgi:HEAT repeat protein